MKSIENFSDKELALVIIKLWYEKKAWAEQLLKESPGLSGASDVISEPYRGRHSIPGTEWFYCTHGMGVDIYKPHNKGGIDFDFCQLHPDLWRLRIFLVKQYNDGQLIKRLYRPLMQDEQRWKIATTQALKQFNNSV